MERGREGEGGGGRGRRGGGVVAQWLALLELDWTTKGWPLTRALERTV